MGLNFLFSSSSFDKPERVIREVVKETIIIGNPNPKNFRIVRSMDLSGYLIVKVNYPEATTFEGDKIMVFRGCTLSELESQGAIDPHFSDNKKYYSPIARFRPTSEGWNQAVAFVKTQL